MKLGVKWADNSRVLVVLTPACIVVSRHILIKGDAVGFSLAERAKAVSLVLAD